MTRKLNDREKWSKIQEGPNLQNDRIHLTPVVGVPERREWLIY